MIEQIDRNRRVEQMTYEAEAVRQQIIDAVGEHRFLAYQLVRLDHMSNREAARYLKRDESTIRRWLSVVDPVIDQLRDESRSN